MLKANKKHKSNYQLDKFIPKESSTKEEIKKIGIEIWDSMGYSFKPNPMQKDVLKSGFLDGKNIIVSAPTASGKTVIAELAIKMALNKGKKGAYVAPMKALADEKKDEWPNLNGFKGKKLMILTGDYQLKPEQKSELINSDIVIMTNEMLDSKSTKFQSENNKWLKDIETLVIDETHLISSEGRGDKLEMAILQFAAINPNAQIVFLSATISKLKTFKDWITKITGRETIIVESTYRPVPLNIEYVPYDAYGKVWDLKPKLIEAVKIIKKNPKDKYLIFCPSRDNSFKVAKSLQQLGFNTEAHNATLGKEERKRIETEFKDGDLQILACTPTLAMGVNLPAKNVIVLGVHRGTTLIDNMDIQQYIGRAGRPKYDKVGNAYVLYPESDEDDDLLEEIKGDINIKSVLNTFDNALFHIIKQIYLGNVYDYKTAVKFWEKTFSYALNGLSIDLQMVLDKLEELGMLKNNECNTIEIQKLGEIAAVFYFSPRDVNRWYNNLKGMIAEPSRWHNDYWLAYLVTSPLQVDAEAWISRKETNDVRAFADVFEKETRRSINPSWAKHTQRNYRILTDKDDSYALRTEVDRRLGSMATVARLYGWDIRKQLEATALRFEYGMGEEAVDLLKIYGIGRVRAGELLKRNIKNAKDIVDNKEIIIDIYKGNGEKIVAGAIKEMTTDDKPSRWYHVSQSIK